ncbi:hypothetical protein F3Y22_tig00111990pilonHSYRG00043 [Hibiscus syriacus]|uniref:RNase H type-1 domain-containing protein n=1 Tax=Hibiscus syriacus TaxID=106335 RepID=A0A6A2YEE3_HIBSY|nr:hypothetical protein F3Y22_tig00111990pilonHSYRG00043 [Hibiscus syriacus]
MSRKTRVASAHKVSMQNQVCRENRTNAKWFRPPTGWFKINADGSRHPSSGLSACAGVILDSNGKWINGFSTALGQCSVLDAELWGLCESLSRAWDLGLRRIVIETNCAEAATILRQGVCMDRISHLAPHLCALLLREWNLKISQTVRENNAVTDMLAKYAWRLPFGVHCFNSPPLWIQPLLESNMVVGFSS